PALGRPGTRRARARVDARARPGGDPRAAVIHSGPARLGVAAVRGRATGRTPEAARADDVARGEPTERKGRMSLSAPAPPAPSPPPAPRRPVVVGVLAAVILAMLAVLTVVILNGSGTSPAPPPPAPGPALFVSPSGRDGNDGTSA